jgi:hypothetical protein
MWKTTTVLMLMVLSGDNDLARAYGVQPLSI